MVWELTIGEVLEAIEWTLIFWCGRSWSQRGRELVGWTAALDLEGALWEEEEGGGGAGGRRVAESLAILEVGCLGAPGDGVTVGASAVGSGGPWRGAIGRSTSPH